MMRLVLALGLIGGLFSGCGSPTGPPRGAVEGSVILDGKPLPSGSIMFRPTAGTKGPSSGTAIVDGRFHLSAIDGPVVGYTRVEVYAPRRTGRKVPPPLRNSAETIDEIIELIPPRYNTQSTLQREVKPGNNILDFNLATR